jgi:hypothetical protein
LLTWGIPALEKTIDSKELDLFKDRMKETDYANFQGEIVFLLAAQLEGSTKDSATII